MVTSTGEILIFRCMSTKLTLLVHLLDASRNSMGNQLNQLRMFYNTLRRIFGNYRLSHSQLFRTLQSLDKLPIPLVSVEMLTTKYLDKSWRHFFYSVINMQTYYRWSDFSLIQSVNMKGRNLCKKPQKWVLVTEKKTNSI